MRTLIALVLALAVAGQSVWAQTADAKHVEKVRSKVSHCLERGSYVAVETYDGRKLGGTVAQTAQDDFVLSSSAGPVTLSYSDVKKIKSPMDRGKRSALVALGVLGGLFGVVFAAALNDR